MLRMSLYKTLKINTFTLTQFLSVSFIMYMNILFLSCTCIHIQHQNSYNTKENCLQKVFPLISYHATYFECSTFFLQLLHLTDENKLDMGPMPDITGQYSSGLIQGEIMKLPEMGQMIKVFPHCKTCSFPVFVVSILLMFTWLVEFIPVLLAHVCYVNVR